MYNNFTEEQTNEANEFFNLLCMGSLDIYVSKLLNSGNKITFEQFQTLKNCGDGEILRNLLDSYSRGQRVKVTFFKKVYNNHEEFNSVPRNI
jgi:hypothetical protein